MAARRDAAQQVKKSPPQRDDGRTPSFGERWAALLGKPTPLWGLAAAAVLVAAGFGAWQWYHGHDATPKRWTAETEFYSECFKTLTTAPPAPPSWCLHAESEQIGPRPFDWINPSVAVYSTAAPLHPSATLRDLADRGQAEAIRFLEQDSGLKGKAWADLGDALDDSKTRVGERDPFKFDRILIANVAKGLDWKPGDRMVWTRVLVEPINFHFAGYSVAETDNETLKVASVEKMATRKFSADLSATVPGVEGPKADFGPSSEHTVKTSSDINAHYEKLGIDIMPNFLRIMRESETGGDAVGNTKLSLTAVTDPDMIWARYPNEPIHRQPNGDPIVLLITGTHFGEDGADKQSPSDEAKPEIDVLPEAPVPHCALRARVWMIYEERKVKDGQEFYDESKQAVTLYHDAEDKQDVDIVSADEVSPAVWSLKLCEDPGCTGEETRFLKAQVPEPQSAPAWRKVVFTDYGVAVRLVRWLRTHPTSKPRNTNLEFNYPREDGASYTSLVPVKVKGDECKGEALERLGSR